MGTFIKANRTFFLLLALIGVSVFGYFWWQSGFTLEFSKFFASEDTDDDGIPDDVDNCWCIQNGAAQADDDHDGFGNKCDEDHPNNECPAACCGGGGQGEDDDDDPADTSCRNANESFSMVFDIPEGADRYNSSTFHDPNAGCDRTTTEGGGGGSVEWNENNGTYRINWNAGALSHPCGRYQFDVAIFGPSGRFDGAGVGMTLNTGVSCGGNVEPVEHLVCQNNACVSVPGGGADQCTTNAECAAAPTHLICQNNACVSVAGVGTNACTTNADCAVVPVLTCTTITPIVSVGQSAQFSATGGTGSYVWFAPGGTIVTGTINPFSTAYTTPGTKTVTVASGGNQVTCPVTVIPAAAALVCAPASVNLGNGQDQVFTASNGTGAFAWSAPAGTPATGGDVASFTTQYGTVGTKVITVTRGTETAVCQATVSATVTALACAPTTQNVALNTPATVTTTGGTGVRAWSAPGGAPASAGDVASFTTQYATAGTKAITVTRGTETVVCQVVVTTASTTPALTIEKRVRNITQGSGEADSANANPADTVEFSLRVSSVGTGTVTNVVVRDALPAGLSYIPGSTTVDGAVAADGVVASGLNLGNMAPGRTITVRFRAIVAPAVFFAPGTSVLTDTGYARGSNAPEVNDVAFVTIVNVPANLTISLIKMGRNITRGETSEHTPVNSSPGQTIEFILRVRNTSSAALTNVMLRDIVPAGITAIPGTVRVDGVVASDVLTGGGLSLGTLSPGQEVVVIFSGVVAPASQLPVGTTTLINTVTVTATGVGMLTAQLPIIISSTVVVVPPIDTGPGESTVLALIISGIITLLYVGYTSTDTYRRHEAGELVKENKDDTFNFRR